MTTPKLDTLTLRSRAMLVTINISVWNPKRKDVSASLDTLIRNSASTKAGAFIKNLLPDGAVDDVKRLEQRIRATFYKWTLPWRDNGIRILPSAAWADFSSEIKTLRSEFEAAVGEFLLNYDTHRAKAQRTLGGLFNPSDYPPVALVRTKFGVNVSWHPLPDGQDFRVDIPEQDLQEVLDGMTQGLTESLHLGAQDLRKRFVDALFNIVDRLYVTDRIFRDSLIINLRELCDTATKLNLTGDLEIESLIRSSKTISEADPDDIRNDDSLRESVCNAARAVLAKIGEPWSPPAVEEKKEVVPEKKQPSPDEILANLGFAGV